MGRNHLTFTHFFLFGLLVASCLVASACGENASRPGFRDGSLALPSGRDSAVHPDAGRVARHDTRDAANAGDADFGTGDAGADGAADGSAPDMATPPDQGVTPDAASGPLTYDVVVVGAGSGGVAVAIQAARLGRSVALVEETDWIGGQMTAASVGCMDDMNRLNEWGIYGEFIARVQKHYQAAGKSFLSCRYGNKHASVEPSVGRAILNDMLADDDVDLFLRTRISAVLSQKVGGRSRVTGVRGERFIAGSYRPVQFDAAVTVDATEHGDLLPLSPARYRAGNSTSDALDPGACVQHITYVAVIKKYPGGVPAKLRLDSPPPGYSAALANSFRALFANEGNWTWGSWPRQKPWSWKAFLAYRGLPDSSNPANYTAAKPERITKTSINITSNDWPYGVAALRGRKVRRTIQCAAKLRTLQVLYYIRHDLGHTDWSIANDEGYDSPYNLQENECKGSLAGFESLEHHMPPMPYVREGHRLIGVKTLTASEAKRVNGSATTNFASSIAVGRYGFDLHECKDESDLEGHLESWSDLTHGNGKGWFQVPLGTLVPQQVDGFLAAEKNISVTRIVNGAIRLQPITMHTGQAAGALAALSIEHGVQPRQVPPILVQQIVAHHDSRLALQQHSDVPPSSPHWPAVQIAAVHRIMVGYPNGSFGVQDTVLRKIGAVVLARVFDLDINNPPSASSFPEDVKTTHPYFAHIEAIKSAGLTTGCGAKRFCPDASLNRRQAAVFVIRGLGLNPANAPTKLQFADVGKNEQNFEYVQLVGEHRLIEPCAESPKKFCPDAPMTRGDLAILAARTLAFMAREDL